MTCPRCKCPTCRAAALNAVLAKHVSREKPQCTKMYRNVHSDIEAHNATILQTTRAKDEWRDTVDDVLVRGRER